MSLTAVLQNRGLTAYVKDPTGGTMDHSLLQNRENADQHPMAAITGLTAALAAKLPATHADDRENPHGVTAEQVGARPDTWLPTPGQIGAAPATESPDYPGCFCRIADGVTEWLNPPMVTGKEYRTTQRYEGKPVYAKAVNFGALPNNTYASASVTAISREKVLSIHGFMANDSGESRPIPYATTYSAPLKGAVDLFARTTGTASIAVVVSTDFDASGWTAMLILRYTKSTD